MTKLLWVVLVMGMLFSLGCHEADEDSTTTEAGKVSQRDPQVTTPAPQAVEPAVTEQALEELVVRLANEHGLGYVAERQVLTGAGFPEAGIPLTQVTGKVQQHLATAGGGSAEAESAVNDILAQLSSLGARAAAGEDVTPEAASTLAESSASEPVEQQVLIHPMSVFGDWISVREEDGSRIIEHSTDGYYEYMQLHFKTNRAMFFIYRDGEPYSHQEYPFQYEPGTGELTLLGPADRTVGTYTIWAYKFDHPIEIWAQKEGSSAMTVFTKKGRAEEPLSEAEIEERERIMREAWGEGAAITRENQ